MVVSVNDKLRAVLRQHFAKGGTIYEAFEISRRPAARRMVDEYDTKKPLAAEMLQGLGEPRQLLGAEKSRGPERRRGGGARQSNQGQRSAAAHERKARLAGVASLVVAPIKLRPRCGRAHVGIVVAGNDRHILRGAEALKPGSGGRIFGRQRQVDEIAGHRDVVRRACPDILRDPRQQVGAMEEAALA